MSEQPCGEAGREQAAPDTPALARKVTKTTVREYDAAGELVSETVTVETARFRKEPERVVGFSKPVEIAR